MTDWHDWAEAINRCITSVPDEKLVEVAQAIKQSQLILTAGNGGSAALASHMAQAIMKPNHAAGGGRAAVCLTDQTALLTAHANDGGWTNALAETAYPYLAANSSVAVIIFSSSGRSPNVVQLAVLAEDYKAPVIVFTGFDGQPLRLHATIAIHVNAAIYEVIEPAHDALLHRVQQHLQIDYRSADTEALVAELSSK